MRPANGLGRSTRTLVAASTLGSGTGGALITLGIASRDVGAVFMGIGSALSGATIGLVAISRAHANGVVEGREEGRKEGIREHSAFAGGLPR